MYSDKILNIAQIDHPLQDSLAKELGISEVLAQLLINRGIRNRKDAEKFLEAKLEHLLDPYNFSDMQKAVALIKKAASNQEKVMVFGDYDVDGVTSLALLKNTFSKIGLEVLHYLPHRVKEGYGLNKNIVRLAKEKKVKLLITVDCGTNDRQEIEALRRANIEVIITDHHEPVNCELPPASSMINPKLQKSGYPYRDLAGVGVAYKLAQGLLGENIFEDLDLVSLGTISDVVPLTGENRIIVKEGLVRIYRSPKVGLKALMETSGIKNKRMSAGVVSFILGPRLNAAGRIDTAEISLNLLMSEEEGEAKTLAQIIESHNRNRQKIESKILQEAEDLIAKEINFKEHKIIVLAKEDWHPGVLGIVAAKIADRFYRPTIVISLNDGFCKGSGRSIKNFHLFDALLACRKHLETFGGHSHAAGLVITRENIKHFKETINCLAREKMLLADLLPTLDIDMELKLSDLKRELIRDLEALEPFGVGNLEPLFYTRGLRLKDEPQSLGRNTLKFWVTDGDFTYLAIGFGMGDFKQSLMQADFFDLVYTPQLDNWQTQDSLILEVKDIFLERRRSPF